MTLHPEWLVPGSTGMLLLGKIFLNFARSMPPPPAQCGFWCRWFFDFVQSMADNHDRIGMARSNAVVVTEVHKDETTTKKTDSSTAATVTTPPIDPPNPPIGDEKKADALVVTPV